MTAPADDRRDHPDLDEHLRLLVARAEPLVRVAPVEQVIRRGRRRRANRRALTAAAVTTCIVLAAFALRYLPAFHRHEAPISPPGGVTRSPSARPFLPGGPTRSASPSPTAGTSASPRRTPGHPTPGARRTGPAPAGSPNAPLSPADMRLTSLVEQDGEELAMGFDGGGSGSTALANYRAQLAQAGWKTSAHQAVKGDATISYDVEGGGLVLFVSQVRVPDLTFQRGTVEGGRTHWYFKASGEPDALAAYQSKLTKLGFRVRDLGGAEEAVHGDTVLHFGADSASVVWVSVEQLG